MKKTLCALLFFCLAFSLYGCASDIAAPDTTNSTSADGTAEAGQDTVGTLPVNTGIDLDLTKLSSTMVYAEVYNMMMSPEEYIGKTVKMHGQFAIYQATDAAGNPVPGQVYYACIIADATACCSQGLEFILAEERKYPEEYPALGTDITVVGEFHTYMEGTQKYCHLTGASLRLT